MSFEVTASFGQDGEKNWDIAHGIIDDELAEEAGHEAVHLIRYAKHYPFMKRDVYAWYVGMYDPNKYEDTERTLLAYDQAKKNSECLLEVISQLRQHRAWLVDDEWPLLFPMYPKKNLALHQDLFTYPRSSTTLLGAAAVHLIDPQTGQSESFIQTPGDEYAMQFTMDKRTSPIHGVQMFDVPRISLLF